MIERIDFPKRYPVPAWLMMTVVVMIFAGIMIHECTQKQLVNEIRISEVVVADYSRVHIEVQYTIQNASRFEREPNLMLKVYDAKGELIASVLYNIKIPARKTQELVKIIDKLDRPLDKGEKPGKVTLEVYPRKVM
jgi:hypothetical protein